MSLRPPASTLADDPLRRALLGRWTVDRRATRAPRFADLAFYRDGRFGFTTADFRARGWGYWYADYEPGAPRARLALTPDAGATLVFRFATEPLPRGPVALADDDDEPRIVLARAGSTEAALAGVWTAPRGGALDALELAHDGGATLRLAGGVARAVRWHFTRDAASTAPRSALAGTLALDPVDTLFPLERWPAMLVDRALWVRPGAHAAALPLARLALDPTVRALLGRWRLVAPRGLNLPEELYFHPSGALEVLIRAGLPRYPGHWLFARKSGFAPDVLEGMLTLSVNPPGQPATREQRRVALPFARNATMDFLAPNGQTALRYRRLFR